MKSLTCRALVVLVAACGGSKSSTPKAAPTEQPAQVVRPDVPFDKLDHDQKIAMVKLLSESELTPENPTGFGCQNCHTTE